MKYGTKFKGFDAAWLRERQEKLAASSVSQAAQPERAVLHEPLAAHEGEKSHTGRVLVSITSRRTRLLDCDNLAGGAKFILDSVRYSGLIRNDDPQSIELKVTQEKVKTKEQECTIIELTEL